MSNLAIRTFESYDAFVEAWHEGTLDELDITLKDARDRGVLDEQATRHIWQLLELLDDEEIIIKIPEWLAEKKIDYTNRSTPTLFVGRAVRETEKAIHFEESAAARPLMSQAHRIQSLKDGLSNTAADADRRDWLERRLEEKMDLFEEREDMVGLQDEWLPKSQISIAFQRKDSGSM